MDWLARIGCDFEMAYSGMPCCSPFRGSLLARCNPHHCVLGHEEDPLEEVNLAHNGEFREKRLELEACLREWEEKTEDFENSRIVREEKV